MAIATEDLRFRVLAQVLGAQAITGLSNQVENLSKKSKGVDQAFKTAAIAVKAFASAYVMNEAIQFGRTLLATADEMDNISQRTGVAVETLSKFKGSVDAADMPLSSFGGFLNKLSKSMIEAANGGKEATAAFKAVGVGVKDSEGQLRPVDAVLLDISQRFSQFKDGPEKAAIAMKLFGKSGAEIIPFLNQGAEQLGKFSLAIDTDFAARAAAFNDSLKEIGISAQNVGISALKELLPTLQEILNTFSKTPSESGAVVTAFQVIGEAIRLAAIAVDAFITSFKQGFDTIQDLATEIAARLKFTFDGIRDSISTTGQQIVMAGTLDFKAVGRLQDEYEARRAEAEKKALAESEERQAEFFRRMLKRKEGFEDRVTQLTKNSLLLGDGSLAEILERQRKETEARAGRNTGGSAPDVSGLKAEERDRVKEFLEQQRLENEQRRQALGDINLTSIELLKVTEARKLEAEAIKAGKTMTAEQRKELMAGTAEIIKQRQALIELEQQQKRSFSGGMREGLRSYVDEATNVGKQVSEAVKRSFTAMEDAILSFVKTGKLSFTDFANSVIDDLVRIAIRQSITAPLAAGIAGLFSPSAGANFGGGAMGPSPFAFANGGIMTANGPLPLRAYSAGGIARSPQLALYGEGSRPEAYVPLPDGKRIPVAMQGGGDTFNISVSVSSDGATSSTGNSEQGKQLGAMIAATVRAELIAQKRPGGVLA